MPSQPKRKKLSFLLCAIFFISGASALIFESVWFNQAGLNLGNSVWASSIVLASFMAGLALGNTLIAIIGDRIHFPLRFYVWMEIIIAVSGILTILLFSKSISFLNPFFQFLNTNPPLLNFSRAVIAFSFMLVPTVAMGATLPLLVKALYKYMPNFGQTLGLLYGWNTLGAMVGVLLNELILIKQFGIFGAGLFAGSLNITVAVIAVFVARQELAIQSGAQIRSNKQLSFRLKLNRPLVGSFMAGGMLLALEVVWFRFLMLFFDSHSWNFAIMLATVLAGISMGGLLTSKWSKINPNIHKYLFYLFLINGLFVVVLYGNFIWLLSFFQKFRTDRFISVAAMFLMFPVSVISGAIFTMLGEFFHSKSISESRAVSLLTMANTTGAMLGALVAGFIFIPIFGMEKTFFLIAFTYGMTAFVFLPRTGKNMLYKNNNESKIFVVIFVIALLLFPFGSMQDLYINNFSSEFYTNNIGEKRVVWRESVTGTIQYLKKTIGEKPYYYRLITNNHSMSATNMQVRRYMKYFVYWPVALLNAPKKALLICFGCGSTAKALTETRSLEEIDIVDISKDIIKLSSVVYPDPKQNPINDQRVKIHIEDGRFFLQTSEKKYDIITAEPPPPSFNGVVNLYSQEYFQLMYDRLENGGIATYWLPGYQMQLSDTKSIVKGFCNVFSDCSLWAGAGFEWMLAGTKNLNAPVTEEQFQQQWQDKKVGNELKNLGFISPEQFGSLFIADGSRLKQWIAPSKPLVDNFPHRLSPVNRQWQNELPAYREFMKHESSMANFMTSKNITRYWPAAMKKAAIQHFPARRIINEMLLSRGMNKYSQLYKLHHCLHDPLLKEYIPWSLNSDYDAIEIVKSIITTTPKKHLDYSEIKKHLVAMATMSGDFLSAENILASEKNDTTEQEYLNEIVLRLYFLILADEMKKAEELAEQYIENSSDPGKSKETITRVIKWSIEAQKK